jgi:hypothetical protein
MYKVLVIGVAIAGISTIPVAARPVSGPTCFNCSNFGGSWHCDTGSIWGGTTCTVTADSCTVSGNCNGGDSTQRMISVGSDTILEIASKHPRVAATVLELTRGGQLLKTASLFWHADAMSKDQVVKMLAGGPAGLAETPGEAVVYDFFVEDNDEGIALVIAPRSDFPEDPVFIEFRLGLALNADAVLVPTSFSFR